MAGWIDVWAAGLWAASLRGGAALLLAWIFSLLPGVPASVRCWAWRAAYGVLIVSLFWRTPVKLALLRPDRTVSSAAVEFGGGAAAPTAPLAAIRPATGMRIARQAPVAAVGSDRSIWPIVAISAWLVWLVAYALRLGADWMKSRRLRRGMPIDVPELAALCRAMGIRWPPAVRVHPAAPGPLLVGVLRPAIILPDSLHRSPQRRLILAHELAHQRRLDLLWNWLPTLTLAALPFHPLVWVGNRRWRLAVEAACDAEALAATEATVADYGRALVSVATTSAMVGAGVLAVAAAGESRWLLKRRLEAMAKIIGWSRRRVWAAGTCIIGVAIFSVVPWRVVAKQQSAPFDAGTTQPVAEVASTIAQPQPPYRYSGLGSITAPTATLRSIGTGTVALVAAHPGDMVKKGTVLLKMDSQAQGDALRSAEQIEKTCDERVELLDAEYKKGLGAYTDFLTARLDAERARDTVLQRKEQLDETTIIAPFDGRVGELDTMPGETVMAGQRVATLVETDDMGCEFAVPVDWAGTLRPGMALALTSHSGERIAGGTLRALEPAADPQTGTIRARAEILHGTEKLWPGEFVVVGWNPAK